MAKRITRKLTAKVRDKIKKDYNKLKLSDFGDDALQYLRKVRGAAKSRKRKADTVAKVGDLVVPKDSEMYQIIQKAAKIKKMTVKQFMKKNKKAIQELMKDGDIVLQRETDYLIKDLEKLKKGKKIFVNDGNGILMWNAAGKGIVIFDITRFTQYIFSQTDIFLIIYRVHYKLDGDMSFYLPSKEEYEELETEEEIIAMLDEYYPEITYLKSAKSRKREKEKPKVIAPYSKKRKHQANSKHGSKRTKNGKVSKRK